MSTPQCLFVKHYIYPVWQCYFIIACVLFNLLLQGNQPGSQGSDPLAQLNAKVKSPGSLEWVVETTTPASQGVAPVQTAYLTIGGRQFIDQGMRRTLY